MELDRLLRTVERWAHRCGCTDDEVERAILLAWYAWDRRSEDFTYSVWARWAVRQARTGRDLPGIKGRKKDALSGAHQGAGMQDVADRTPPPDVLADSAERWERLMRSLTKLERYIVRLSLRGVGTVEIARRVKLTASRVSQIKRSIAERF